MKSYIAHYTTPHRKTLLKRIRHRRTGQSPQRKTLGRDRLGRYQWRRHRDRPLHQHEQLLTATTMYQITLKIQISDELFKNEYRYFYGELMNELVTFTYMNTKTGKETEKKMTYRHALSLAQDRARDRRYKNYEYIITA